MPKTTDAKFEMSNNKDISKHMSGKENNNILKY